MRGGRGETVVDGRESVKSMYVAIYVCTGIEHLRWWESERKEGGNTFTVEEGGSE